MVVKGTLNLVPIRRAKLLEARDRFTEKSGGKSRLSEVADDYKNLDIQLHFEDHIFDVPPGNFIHTSKYAYGL